MDITSELIEGHASRLSEHFDSVLIIATKNEECVTRLVVRRRGNYYASKGAAIEWLENESQQELAKEIADKLPKED